MKHYKDENNQIYAYEDDVPDFGSYTEIEIINEEGKTVIEKVYPEFTVKEGLIAITEDEADVILNPPKSDEEIQAEIVATNTDTQVALTKEANTAISILQDAIDFDMQEDGDEEKLKAWKKYRILLSRVDLTIDDVEWPEKPM